MSCRGHYYKLMRASMAYRQSQRRCSNTFTQHCILLLWYLQNYTSLFTNLVSISTRNVGSDQLSNSVISKCPLSFYVLHAYCHSSYMVSQGYTFKPDFFFFLQTGSQESPCKGLNIKGKQWGHMGNSHMCVYVFVSLKVYILENNTE